MQSLSESIPEEFKIYNWLWLVVCLCFLIVMPQHTHARIITIDQNTQSLDITEATEYLETKNFKLSALSISSFYQNQFTSVHKNLLKSDLSENSLWIRLQLNSTAPEARSFYLVTQSDSPVSIQKFVNQQPDHETGRHIPYPDRPVVSHRLAIPLTVEPGTNSFILKINGDSSSLLAFRLQTPSVFYSNGFKELSLKGTLFALYCILAVITFYTGLKNRYLDLILISGVASFHMLSLFGYAGFLSPWVPLANIDFIARHFSLLISATLTLILVSRLISANLGKLIHASYYGSIALFFAAMYSLSSDTLFMAWSFQLMNLAVIIVLAITLSIRDSTLALITSGTLFTYSGIAMFTHGGILDSLAIEDTINPLLFLAAMVLLSIERVSFFREGLTQEIKVNTDQIVSLVPRFIAEARSELALPAEAISEFSKQLIKSNLSVRQRQLLSTLDQSGQQVRDSINRLEMLFHALSDQKVYFEALDIQQIVLESCRQKTTDAQHNSTEIVCDVDSSVPLSITSSKTCLEFVIKELLNLSVQQTKQGDISCRVSFVDNKQLRIRITDTGIPLTQDHNLTGRLRKHNQQDTQLILPLCGMLIDRMGGSMGKANSARKGTSYWVTIPVTEYVSFQQELTEARRSLHARTLLVVDDNQKSRKVLESYANSMGMKADIAANGFEAMSILQTRNHLDQAYDFILADVDMPELSGIQFANRIHSDARLHSYNSLILMSSSGIKINSRELEESNIRHQIQKPVSLREFYKTLISQLPANRSFS